MEIIDKHVLNPWTSMWIQPRATIQQIIDTNPKRFVLTLAALAGVSNHMLYAQWGILANISYDLEWGAIVFYALFAGALEGIAALFIMGALIHYIGTFFDSKASSINIRAAIAWSHIPVIWSLIFWMPLLAVYLGIFAKFTGFDFFVSTLVQVAFKIYTLVLSLKCLRQIQGISKWNAFLNLFLCLLIICMFLFAFTVFKYHPEISKQDIINKEISDYTEAIRANPRNCIAYFNRGNSYYDKGQYDQAIMDC